MISDKKILVVDDDRTTAKIVALQLQKMGFAVSGIAKSALEAIDKTETTAPDLVLMDIKLGRGMDGIDAAGIIMDKFRVPVIYLTAYADEEILARALATKPVGYVNKPLREKDLRTTICLAFGQIGTPGAPVTGPGGDPDKLWEFQVDCDPDGEIRPLRPNIRKRMKGMNLPPIEELLPENHLQLVEACLASRNSRLVTEELRNGFISCEYQPAVNNTSVHIKVTCTGHGKPSSHERIEHTILLEAMDQLATGIVLIKENLRIFYSNKSAEKLLESGNGLYNRDGYLSCSNPEYTSDLQKTVLEGADHTLTIERGGSQAPLHMLITPLQTHRGKYGQDLPTTMVFAFESLNDTERVEDVLRSLYNLSPTEARIAARLVMTPNLDQVAESLGITQNTARTHLKHIYTKTKTNRLSTLLHLIVTGPVGVILQSAT